jgi:type IV secretory pathway VirB3-like protein
MATETRTNTVFKALHKPLLILGIERKMFAGIIFAAYLMHFATQSIIAALCVGAFGMVIGRYLTSKDVIFMTVLLQSAQFKTIYDAAKHTPAKVVIR